MLIATPRGDADLDAFEVAHKIRINQIRHEQIQLLFDQAPFLVIGECLVAIILTIALSGIVSSTGLQYWLFYVPLFVGVYRIVLCYLHQYHLAIYDDIVWTRLFTLSVFLSGLGWGVIGSFLMPHGSLMHQMFIIFVLFGITTAANAFLSPIRYLYLIFLLPIFLPFVAWLFLQGGLYGLFGLCALVYLVAMLIISYYTYRFIQYSFKLRSQNKELGFSNEILETQIAYRTQDLKKSLAIIQATLDSTTDALLVVNLKGHIDYYNQHFVRLWSLSEALLSDDNGELVFDSILKQLKVANPEMFHTTTLLSEKKDEFFNELECISGRIVGCYSRANMMDNEMIGWVWRFRDVTSQKQLENQLIYEASHDVLTGLPNRNLLNDRIQQGMTYCKRANVSLAVTYFDLDGFKLINDNLGHDTGDLLLIELAHRLTAFIRESDTIARVGGDEFVILVMNVIQDELPLLLNGLLDLIKQPFHINHEDLRVSASMGISMYPNDGLDAGLLLKKADIAMYMAKHDGRNHYQFYHEPLKPA